MATWKDQERTPGGPGGGRQSTRRAQARREGRTSEADALAPPSERKLLDSEKCGALTGSGNPCRNAKGSRTDHPGYGNCVKHGGNTEAGIKSAMREMGRDLARRFKADVPFGGDRRDPAIATLTPEQAMLEEVRRSAAFVRFLEERIARWNLSPEIDAMIEAYATARPANYPRRADEPTLKIQLEELVNEVELPALTKTSEKTGLTGFTDAREWLYLYREERGHLARVSKMCIDAGVAQRLVTLAEDQGRILATAIRAVLNALALTPEQSAKIPQIVPPILRAVANDQPVPDISSLTNTSASYAS